MNTLADSEKEKIYKELLPRVKSLFEAETDRIACMANASAILMEAFHHHWVGFYRVDGERLVLGPFQGPLACMSIKYGRGVCGTSWKDDRTVIVPDVDKFPGHIACSCHSRSEIVVPVHVGGEAVAVLDIDSAFLDAFSEVDARYLEEMCSMFR